MHCVQAAEWQLEEARFTQERQKREKANGEGVDGGAKVEGCQVLLRAFLWSVRDACRMFESCRIASAMKSMKSVRKS